MNRISGVVTVVVAVLGFWGGFKAWHSAGVGTNILAGVAIVIGCNLLFCVWLWHRAQPGSGDAMFLPGLVVLSGSMLLGVLPRLFWPAAENLQIAGSIASVLGAAVALVMQMRSRRKIRGTAGPQ
jgi:hypothetical protein